MRTIFSLEVQNDQSVVTIGKWPSIPTGAFCCLKTRCLYTAPVMTAKQVSTFRLFVGANHLTIARMVWSIRKSFVNRPFASELDRWSVAFQDMRAQFDITATPFDCDAYNKTQTLLSRLSRQSLSDMDTLIDLLETFQPSPFLERLKTIRADAASYKATLGKEAAEKAAQTRAAAKLGGNPKTWNIGDVVVSVEPMSFQNGGTHSKFYYVPSAQNPKGNPGFYVQIDQNGHGIGYRYKAIKKSMRKVCPNTFTELTRFSAHERLALLQEQAHLAAIKERQLLCIDA